MKNQKSESGITLIALVVTIVVLLILAGVTIVYVLQDGSVFESAKESAVETTVTSISDYAQQMQVEATTQWYVHNTDIAVQDKTSTVTGKKSVEIQTFFPSSMAASVDDGSTLESTNGKLTGKFTVTTGETNYKMEFEDGILYCTNVGKNKYTGLMKKPEG